MTPIPLRRENLTPDLVLMNALEEAQDKRSVYIVTINKKGDPELWCTGDLRDMSFALQYFQHVTIRYFRDEVDEQSTK